MVLKKREEYGGGRHKRARMASGGFRGQAAMVSRAHNDATSKPECAKSICMNDAPFCHVNCMGQGSPNKGRRLGKARPMGLRVWLLLQTWDESVTADEHPSPGRKPSGCKRSEKMWVSREGGGKGRGEN